MMKNIFHMEKKDEDGEEDGDDYESFEGPQ